MTHLLVAAGWVLVALGGLVCLDVCSAPDPRAAAWTWARIPHFFGLMIADVTVTRAAKYAGAWRHNPDTDDDAPVYLPTTTGRRLVLLSCKLMENISAHPLAPIVGYYIEEDYSSNVARRREQQLAAMVGDYKWRDVPRRRTA